MSTYTDTLITRDNERVARIAIADPPHLGRAALDAALDATAPDDDVIRLALTQTGETR